MVRAHNFIANELAALNNTGWDDEILFQESRKILIALFQHFVYKEYLPELLGVNLATNNLLVINATGFQDDYDDTLKETSSRKYIPVIFHTFIPRHPPRILC
jgi:peroxidase